jgi:hypothetical protein
MAAKIHGLALLLICVTLHNILLTKGDCDSSACTVGKDLEYKIMGTILSCIIY